MGGYPPSSPPRSALPAGGCGCGGYRVEQSLPFSYVWWRSLWRLRFARSGGGLWVACFACRSCGHLGRTSLPPPKGAGACAARWPPPARGLLQKRTERFALRGHGAIAPLPLVGTAVAGKARQFLSASALSRDPADGKFPLCSSLQRFAIPSAGSNARHL